MSLIAGTRLGPYELVAPIGAGGMGEVYRAHDARLKRDVAIKVLPTTFARDEERLRRFEQEALATAALNHPNILVVFDVGSEHDIAYVVEELLEGRTLRELMAEERLPVRKTVDYASQLAAGLAAAHDKGIVHRDLKPENLFVTAEGRVKILDFGLAKQVASGQAGGSESRTVLAGTEPGLVLGTMGYMAPEQVRGEAVDHRADIFAFGAILYELLSGRRAFAGDTPADTMTAILKESPQDLTLGGPAIPPALARLVDRCLEKRPSARFQSASDLAFALQTMGSGSGSGSAIAAPAMESLRASRRPWVVGAAGMAIGLVALTFAAWRSIGSSPTADLTVAYLELAPPQGTEIEDWVAFSPDGKRIAFPASDVSDRRQLWVRDLGTGTSRSLAGTNDARSPFWSPDGQSIAFFADGRLRIVDSEGRIRMVCEAVGIRTGGTWSPSGVIVFASEANVPLMKVNADGKSPPTPFDGLHGFRPQFLPDGRHVLFAGRQGIEVVNVDTGKRLTLRPTGREPKYVDGHLLFVEEQRVLAQPFDPDGMTLSGEPLAIADIGPFRGDVGGNYSVAGSRLLAFKRATPSNRQLVWRARDGTQLGVIDGAGDWWNPALSPDDSRVAAQRNELQGTEYDIWVHEVARGAIRILSSARANEILPFWTAGGAHIAFQRVDQAIIAKPADGGPEVLLLDKGFSRGSAVGLSPDERLLLTFRLNTDGNRDIVVVPLDGRTDPFPFAATPFNETQPALSPDGAWLAYTSDELGLNSTRDVFIQAFPGGGKKQHVTAETGGGLQPRWRRDGRELYFLSLDSRLMAVPVERTAGTLGLGKPRALFQIAVGSDGGLGTRAAYDVTRDGQRFIVAEDRSGRSADATPVTVLVDWIRAVRAQNR